MFSENKTKIKCLDIFSRKKIILESHNIQELLPQNPPFCEYFSTNFSMKTG